ncbi:MAG TPA: Abi-alpha family protein [Solirubrobacteraceae bacterium]|nr:Abi-alpha family protein [Solirubrobacteraceae bacterium]
MSDGSDLLAHAPGLTRIAAGVWWRAARWSVGASVRTSVRVARAAADPVLSAQVVSGLGHELREYARDLLGVTELDARVRKLAPAPDRSHGNGSVPPGVALRLKGALLLRAAADIDGDDDTHPAYARILTELAPDEGRILRLFATEGSQPSVDVRTTSLIGVGSQLVGAGLNMIGAQAGCRHRDRVPAYLNNLERLGLIWFSHEPLDDPIAYQVLEAQPEVMQAIHGASRARTQQRSIHLTPFGKDFCRVCLPLDPGEVEALTPEHEPPPGP